MRRPIRRDRLRVETVAAAHTVPVGVEDPVSAAARRRGRAAPAPVVLQPAAHEVRLPHIGAHRVELPGGHGVHVFPRSPLVVADRQSAVISDHQVIAVVRIDPDRVMIAVWNPLDRAPRFAPVDGLEERRAALVGDLGFVGSIRTWL